MIRFQIFKIVDRQLLWHSLSFIHWLRSTIILTFSVIYPLTLIDDYSDIQCHFSIDFDCQCHQSSMLSMIIDNRFRSLSFVSVVSVVIVFNNCRRSSMSSMIDRCRSSMSSMIIVNCQYRQWLSSIINVVNDCYFNKLVGMCRVC